MIEKELNAKKATTNFNDAIPYSNKVSLYGKFHVFLNVGIKASKSVNTSNITEIRGLLNNNQNTSEITAPTKHTQSILEIVKSYI